MPAYLRSCQQLCSKERCAKTATVALYDGQNSLVAVYCLPHGNAALAARMATEAIR